MIARFAMLTAGAFVLWTSAAAADSRPAVVELFTSQSCFSCPPAERYLGELAGQDGVLALEFHVDYWDSLVYGSAGKWRDVFSKRAYTDRQVGYNQRIRGRSGVYTPQMIVDGRIQTVGSNRSDVQDAIERSGTHGGGRVDVEVAVDGKGARVQLSGSAGPSEVWLVRFIRKSLTEVRAGENKGKDLVNHNVVTELRSIGRWRGKPASLSVRDFSLAEGEGCAVLVQDRDEGPVLGAALCPDPVS